MADKLMYITNNDTQIYPFCRLIETYVSTNQNLKSKVPKVVKANELENVIRKLWRLKAHCPPSPWVSTFFFAL